MSWVVPLDALPGLILPNVVAQWPVFTASRAHASAELAGGLVPVVILAACLWYGGRSALRPPLGGERCAAWPCSWPSARPRPSSRTASAGCRCSSWRWAWRPPTASPGHATATPWPSPPARCSRCKSPGDAARKLPNLGRLALVLVLAVWGREMLTFPWVDTHLVSSGAVVALVVLLWSFVEAGSPVPVAAAWAPCGVALLTCWVAYRRLPHLTDVPVWKFGDEVRQAEPLDPHVRYLSVHTVPDVFDFDRTGSTSAGAA